MIGRYDFKIPDYVIADIGIDTLLEPILSRLRTLMVMNPKPILRTHNVVFVPVGSYAQQWFDCDCALLLLFVVNMVNILVFF